MAIERAFWRDIEQVMEHQARFWFDMELRLRAGRGLRAMQPGRAPSTHTGVLPGFGVFAPNADVQIFTPAISSMNLTPGTAGQDGLYTWVKPPGVQIVMMWGTGAGAGGGSGRKGSTTTISCGGGGGGAGNFLLSHAILASDLPDQVDLIVGCGGAGGQAVSVNSTNGNSGALVTNTQFGSSSQTFSNNSGNQIIRGNQTVIGLHAGNGGGGGTASSGTNGSGGDGSRYGTFQGAPGASASTVGGTGSTGNQGIYVAGGGGSGGGLTAANVAANGGGGGMCGQYSMNSGSGGGGNTGSSAVMDAGTSVNALLMESLNSSAQSMGNFVGFVLPTDRYFQPGAGGGGGAASNGAVRANGGNGGNAYWGGGGGGGGAATDSVGNSGSGGNGGDSYLIVVSW